MACSTRIERALFLYEHMMIADIRFLSLVSAHVDRMALIKSFNPNTPRILQNTESCGLRTDNVLYDSGYDDPPSIIITISARGLGRISSKCSCVALPCIKVEHDIACRDDDVAERVVQIKDKNTIYGRGKAQGLRDGVDQHLAR